MNADQLIEAIAYVVIGGFIAVGLVGAITGSTMPYFDLLAIAAGTIALVWVGRNA